MGCDTIELSLVIGPKALRLSVNIAVLYISLPFGTYSLTPANKYHLNNLHQNTTFKRRRIIIFVQLGPSFKSKSKVWTKAEL